MDEQRMILDGDACTQILKNNDLFDINLDCVVINERMQIIRILLLGIPNNLPSLFLPDLTPIPSSRIDKSQLCIIILLHESGSTLSVFCAEVNILSFSINIFDKNAEFATVIHT